MKHRHRSCGARCRLPVAGARRPHLAHEASRPDRTRAFDLLTTRPRGSDHVYATRSGQRHTSRKKHLSFSRAALGALTRLRSTSLNASLKLCSVVEVVVVVRRGAGGRGSEAARRRGAASGGGESSSDATLRELEVVAEAARLLQGCEGGCRSGDVWVSNSSEGKGEGTRRQDNAEVAGSRPAESSYSERTSRTCGCRCPRPSGARTSSPPRSGRS